MIPERLSICFLLPQCSRATSYLTTGCLALLQFCTLAPVVKALMHCPHPNSGVRHSFPSAIGRTACWRPQRSPIPKLPFARKCYLSQGYAPSLVWPPLAQLWKAIPMGSSSTPSAQSRFPHSLVDFVAKSTLQWMSCRKVSVRETVFWELNLRHLIDLHEFHFCLHDSIGFCCLQSNAVMRYHSSGYFHCTIFFSFFPIYWVPTIWPLKITLQCKYHYP